MHFALKQLSVAASSNGLKCERERHADSPQLLCQFDQLLYNAIITTTSEHSEMLRVDMYYFDEKLGVDQENEARIKRVVRRFAKGLRGSHYVKAVQQCEEPLRADREGMCYGQSLW